MKFAPLALAALLLAGCATTGSFQITQERGLAAAWSSLDAIAVSLDALALSHTLHGPKALMAATDLSKARDALTAADAAYHAGNAANAQQNVILATSLIAELVAIAQSPGVDQ